MLNQFSAIDLQFSHGGTSSAVTINSATTTNGSNCDLSDFDAAIGILRYGAVTTAATQANIKIQMSDNGSSWTDVFDFIAGDSNHAAFTPADTDDGKHLIIGIDLRVRKVLYWRWSIVTTGTPNFALVSGFIGVSGKFNPTVKSNANRLGAGIYRI